MLFAHFLAILVLALFLRAILAYYERAYAGFGAELSSGGLFAIKLSHALRKIWLLLISASMALDLAVVSLLQKRAGWLLDVWAYGCMLLPLFTLLLITSWLLAPAPRKTIVGDFATPPNPTATVILWRYDGAQIEKMFYVTENDFNRLFLDRYANQDERPLAPQHSTVVGLLIARSVNTAVSVPIRTWKTAEGNNVFLCQASIDGNAPEFSVYSPSEEELLGLIGTALGEGAAPVN